MHDSLNHYSYGAISGWLISGVLGIKYSYDEVVIEPYTNRELGFAKGYYDSPRGRISSEWKYDADGEISYHIEIPEGLCATVRIPGSEEKKLPGGIYDLGA